MPSIGAGNLYPHDLHRQTILRFGREFGAKSLTDFLIFFHISDIMICPLIKKDMAQSDRITAINPKARRFLMDGMMRPAVVAAFWLRHVIIFFLLVLHYLCTFRLTYKLIENPAKM